MWQSKVLFVRYLCSIIINFIFYHNTSLKSIHTMVNRMDAFLQKWIYSLHKICLGSIHTFKDLFLQINLFDTRQKFYHCFLELNFMLKRTGCFFDPTPPLPIFPVNDHNLNSYTGIDFFLPHYHSL